MNESAHPSPALFFETVNSYQRTAALKAAIDLDLFTAIGEGNQTTDKIAKRCDVSERGARILSDYLVIVGFLTKHGARYSLTVDSATFLDRRSPVCIASAVEFLLSPALTDGFKDLASTVRKGGTILPDEGALAPEHPVWVKFARAMAPMLGLEADLIVKLLESKSPLGPGPKILDIAAGHGLFGIAFAKQIPDAEVIAVDWPNVLEVAKENAQQAGVTDRYRTIAGSAFEVDFGGGYDLVLLTNFLHHFDPSMCETIIKKAGSSLSEGGRIVTLEFVPNEDRVSPPVAAAFSLMMLGGTPQGDAYTFSELDQMFQNAGFAKNELHPLPPTFQQVVISHR